MFPQYLKLEKMGEKLSKLAAIGDARLGDSSLEAVSVASVADGAKVHIMSRLAGRKLIVTADSLAAKSLYERLKKYPETKVCYLPHRDDVLIPRKSFSRENVYERSSSLAKIVFGEADTLIAAADALIQPFSKPELIKRYTLNVSKNEVLSPQDAADRLAVAGYVRQELISERGDFALRGDILDVYRADGAAVRINFFDETVENIKLIDPVSMLALNDLEYVIIPPASDILLDEKTYDFAKQALIRLRDNRYAEELLSAIRTGACTPSAVWGLPFMSGATAPLTDYFGGISLIVFDEPKVISEKLTILSKEFAGRIETLLAGGEILSEHASALYPTSEVRRGILKLRKISFSSLDISNPFFEPKLIIKPRTRAVPKYYLDPESIYSDLRNYLLNGLKILIAAGSPERAKGIMDSLTRADIYSEYSEDGNGKAGVLVSPLAIENGFVYPDLKICVIGVSECIGRHRGESVAATKTQFTAPKAGDYVVHRVHGIGYCEGTTILKTGEFEKEYVVLRYRDGDVLYVATDQMDNLQKFVGEENPKLNKIGGREFEKEKEKVRSSVKKLAVNLLQLYAKREKQKGFVYPPDDYVQQAFEDGFEYEETEDQLKAIEAVKRDMESGQIMDRLIVGDVGFGKTEIAFRAMLKTVLAGKQAILLAPTTILARQHHENLNKRLEPFGIRCGLLTRLQSPSENKRTEQALADGAMEIVVATHRVLSKNITFSDPGLLVLDEEQRFGVEHKEKLKERYPLINVLTLSATPIPRTLNMALSGVRDISLLETAPKGRLPIQTYVVEYSDALAADAVTRETARGGQTLVLLNDIEALDSFAFRLNAVTGGRSRIITAHGQMAAGELERRIAAFYDKSYDVLVATTIIENGIDLPDANTLIVIDSERFGLSQLYQLRGRVGRRGALAHAYFTVPPNGALTSTAEKRLRALLDNTEIGSGFKVALSDLSIRGAGTLLGAEQHGHMEKVGYEMYIELLDEAVEELKTGKTRRGQRDVEIKIDAPAYIRDGFIGGRDKLRIFKRISDVSSAASRDKLIGEIKEIYGEAEQPLVNLINISLLKNLAKGWDVSKITVNRGGAGVNFYDSDVFANEVLMRAVADLGREAVLTSTIPPSLIFDVKNLRPEQKIEKLLHFFAGL